MGSEHVFRPPTSLIKKMNKDDSIKKENGIHIVSATYGGNCDATLDNNLENLKAACNGQMECSYVVNKDRIGDPAKGCKKEYEYTYHCGDGNEKIATIAKEANLTTLSISCYTGEHKSHKPKFGSKAASEFAGILRVLKNSGVPVATVSEKTGLSDVVNDDFSNDVVNDVAVIGESDTISEPTQLKFQNLRLKPTKLYLPQVEFEKSIKILSATHGENCGEKENNDLSNLEKACAGKHQCSYEVDLSKGLLGCKKNYSFSYKCGNGDVIERTLPDSAGQTINLECNIHEAPINSDIFSYDCSNLGNTSNLYCKYAPGQHETTQQFDNIDCTPIDNSNNYNCVDRSTERTFRCYFVQDSKNDYYCEETMKRGRLKE